MDGLAIAAALNEMRSEIEDGWIRAIYQPTRSMFVLHVFSSKKRKLLISPRDASIHLTSLDIPNPEQPSTFVMQLRKHLKGGRITSVAQRGWDRIVSFEIERRAGSRTLLYELIAELAGVRGNLILARDGRVIGSSRRDARNPIGAGYAPLPPQDRVEPRTLTPKEVAPLIEGGDIVRALARSIDGMGRRTAEDLMARIDSAAEPAGQEVVAERLSQEIRRLLGYVGEISPHVDRIDCRAAFYPLPPPAEATSSFSAALDAVEFGSVPGEIAALDDAKRIRRAIDRRQRTVVKLCEWLDSYTEAARLQALADLVMIHHRDIEPKAETATLIDPETEQPVVVRLQPALSAIENAQRLYGRAKRLRRGKPHVTLRLKRIERELEQLRQAQTDFLETESIDEEVVQLLAGKPKTSRGPAQPTFRSAEAEGFTIWIGRNATDNDRLLRAAAPNDVWMHVEGHPGSHVIVRRGSADTIPQSVLRHAARLAAAGSKARTERRVQVTIADVKHVRKPKRAPAGLVHVRNADTLTVEPMREAE